jgi:hypothetical protein
MPPSAFPSRTPNERRQREAELHASLLAGHREASYEVFHFFHLPLLRRLRSNFPRLRDDPDLEGCLLQALNDYLLRPASFQPGKGSLFGYLYHAAHRDVLNLLESRGRRAEEPLEPEKVAEWQGTRKEEVERTALEEMDGLPEEVELRDLEARLRAGLRPEDHPLIPLVLSERTPLEPYVRALGLEALSREEQERVVKRAKDRIYIALRRLKRSYHDGG